jgi:hypothetical protein
MPTFKTTNAVDSKDHVIGPLISTRCCATTDHAYHADCISSEEPYDKAIDMREANDGPPAAHKTSSLLQQFRSWWNDGWVAEVMSCALSVVAMACLITTLRYFDGHVLTQMPLKISINTLVAIMAAVVKSSLLLPVAECISQSKWLWYSKTRPLVDFESFDLASRGPWGSLLLVFQLRSWYVMKSLQ